MKTFLFIIIVGTRLNGVLLGIMYFNVMYIFLLTLHNDIIEGPGDDYPLASPASPDQTPANRCRSDDIYLFLFYPFKIPYVAYN